MPRKVNNIQNKKTEEEEKRKKKKRESQVGKISKKESEIQKLRRKEGTFNPVESPLATPEEKAKLKVTEQQTPEFFTNEQGGVTGIQQGGKVFLGSLGQDQLPEGAVPVSEAQAKRDKQLAVLQAIQERGVISPEQTAPIEAGTNTFFKFLGRKFEESVNESVKSFNQKKVEESDSKLVTLGLPLGPLAAGAIGGIASSGIFEIFTRPIISPFKFQERAVTLRESITPFSEQMSVIVQNARTNAYGPGSVAQAEARIDSAEQQIADIEENIRVAAAKSGSIASSGKLPGVIGDLDKMKEQIIFARNQLFIIRQSQLSGFTEAEVQDLEREYLANI